jgi:hypothetical protein
MLTEANRFMQTERAKTSKGVDLPRDLEMNQVRTGRQC